MWLYLGLAVAGLLGYELLKDKPQSSPQPNPQPYPQPWQSLPATPVIPTGRLRVAPITSFANVSVGTILDIDSGGIATTNVPATLVINPGTPNSYLVTAPSIVTVRWPQGNTSTISVTPAIPMSSGNGPF